MAIIEVKVPQLSESVAEATLLSWHKKAGDAVAVGQPLLILEAMKMENEIRAESEGVVEKVLVADGQTVESGQVLVVLRAS